MAPMEVSRVTSGVPPSVLPHILGTARWEAAAAGGGAGRGKGEARRAVREGGGEYRGLGDISCTLQKQPSSCVIYLSFGNLKTDSEI